jgi:lauroyl/myristoyl acyltransferase
MAFSFTKFKDRVSGSVYSGSQRLAVAPKPVQKVIYSLLRGVIWLIYIIPGSYMRKTVVAFAAAIEQDPPREIYRGFANGFLLFAQRMEMLSQGRTDIIDQLLKIPEKARFEAILKEHGGVILTMPHCHGSLLMVRGLSARYPVLMLIREPKKDERAASQRRYFANMGCEVLDVRRSNEAAVARTVLKALRKGKIVIGTVDRIQKAPPPDEPVSKTSDCVRTMIFDQPAGIAGWPARFAAKCKVPILPIMVEHDTNALTLHIGDPITATDIVATTQKWVSALEDFFQRFPGNWIFVYDKHWSRLLRNRMDQA